MNKVSGFEILLDDKLPLGKWEGIFKVLELEDLNLPMIYPDGIKKSKGKEEGTIDTNIYLGTENPTPTTVALTVVYEHMSGWFHT